MAGGSAVLRLRVQGVLNLDGDPLGDVCDPDDDNDGVDDVVDNFPIDANPGQQDIDVDGACDECDATFDTGSVIDAIEGNATSATCNITTANPPGGNGMIAKLTGNGGVVPKVADAVADFEEGTIDSATYVAELLDALAALDAFDNQLAAKITNGQIVDPEATELQELSAEIRMLINALIGNA